MFQNSFEIPQNHKPATKKVAGIDYRKPLNWACTKAYGDNYYNYPLLSNSGMNTFLGEKLEGKYIENALRFGDAFHQYVLENKESFEGLNEMEVEKLKNMADNLAMSQNPLIQYFYMSSGRVEHEFYRKMYGVYCKAKADKIILNQKKQRVIFELKTTSEKNDKEFSKTFQELYARPTAFYLDVCKASQHIVIPVSKATEKPLSPIVTLAGSKKHLEWRESYKKVIGQILDTYD